MGRGGKKQGWKEKEAGKERRGGSGVENSRLMIAWSTKLVKFIYSTSICRIDTNSSNEPVRGRKQRGRAHRGPCGV